MKTEKATRSTSLVAPSSTDHNGTRGRRPGGHHGNPTCNGAGQEDREDDCGRRAPKRVREVRGVVRLTM